MLTIVQSWLGTFSKEELKKFLLLSLTFGTIIGTYWLLRPLKISIFISVVGAHYIPLAKILSLFFIIPIGIVYSKLVEIFPRQRMFYIMCTLYALIGLLFAFLMYNSSIGLANKIADPDRWWGWAWFFYVESFGILIVSLFWAFAADITTPDSASRGYPIIALGGQIGNIVAPWLLGLLVSTFTSTEIGPEGQLPPTQLFSNELVIVGMVILSIICMGFIMALITFFMQITPKNLLIGFKSKESTPQKQGFLQGMILIFSSPYLASIFAIIIFNGIIGTILDFNFNNLIKINFPDVHLSTAYLASHAMWVGIISTLSIVLGINKIQRWLGLGISLTLLPILVACSVLIFKTNPTVHILFWILVVLKAINYALNQPSMKQLYIPTTNQAKYQSQAFIDLSGSRFSRAVGSGINYSQKFFTDTYGLELGLKLFTSFYMTVSFGIIGIWIFIALFLGHTYKKAVDKQEAVI